MSSRSGELSNNRRRTPDVAKVIRVDELVFVSNRIAYPINDSREPRSLAFSPSSCDTLRARDMAEIRRGCVTRIRQSRPEVSSFSRMYEGTCVLFPAPVSAHKMV